MTTSWAGVCVFDYDGTVTGKRAAAAKQLIKACIDNGFALAVNTARFRMSSKMKSHFASLGVDVDLLPAGAVQLKAYTSKRKARAMERIMRTYNALPHQLLLYDNRESNVRRVRQHGYYAVNIEQQGMLHPLSVLR